MNIKFEFFIKIDAQNFFSLRRFYCEICYLMIILTFFYVVNLRTKFDETLGRISDLKNFGRGFEDQSTNLDSNPRPDIKILGRRFKSSAESFRYAAGYLKLIYQTGCSNQPRYCVLGLHIKEGKSQRRAGGTDEQPLSDKLPLIRCGVTNSA